MTIDKAFNETVEYYDNWMQKALPCYHELFSVAVESIPFAVDERIKILDLGAGTGLFSWQVFQRYQKAEFILYDVADKMLDVARKRFSGYPQQFSFISGDYKNWEINEEVDLVISSLSIHHLDETEKQDLFGNIYSILKPDGVFINVDQILGTTSFFEELYWSVWLRKVRQAEADEQTIQESVKRRRKFDRDSTLFDQIKWLNEAGFSDVDCLYKHYFVGVFLAVKQ